MVRVDFGAAIDINSTPLLPQGEARLSKQAWVTGTINYSDGSQADLVYIKTTLLEDLSEDLNGYRRLHPGFPDESTADQFFDETQFEAYRELGYQVGKRVCGEQVCENMDGFMRSCGMSTEEGEDVAYG